MTANLQSFPRYFLDKFYTGLYNYLAIDVEWKKFCIYLLDVMFEPRHVCRKKVVYKKSGVAPGIFRRGMNLTTRGLKYVCQGTIIAKNLRKNRFSPSDGGLACSDEGTIVIPLFAQPHFHISACLFTYFRLFICILRHSFAYAYSFAYHFASYNYACAFVAKRCYTCKRPYCLRNPHCLLSHFVSYT